MSVALDVMGALFWGAVTISVLVFMHECGHFVVARACGVRVKEVFLGLPCRLSARRFVRRWGTSVGASPLLLGGSAQICGLDPLESPYAAAVLAVVNRRGREDVATLAQDLRISEDQALDACLELEAWGSIAAASAMGPATDRAAGTASRAGTGPGTAAGPGPATAAGPGPGTAAGPGPATAAGAPRAGAGTGSGAGTLRATSRQVFEALPRDPTGATPYDAPAFDRRRATAPGQPWRAPVNGLVFLERERTHVFQGKRGWQRLAILFAGIAVNLLFGVALLTGIYAVAGAESGLNVVGSVLEDSPAAEAGLAVGDTILSIDGIETQTWAEIQSVLATCESGQTVSIVCERDGQSATVQATLAEDTVLGLKSSYLGIETTYVELGILESLMRALSGLGQTALTLVSLFIPSRAGTALQSTQSIAAIFSVAARAAGRGAVTYLKLVVDLSFSLGLINLLPILPLDGGRIAIELVQAATGREVSARVRGVSSLVGMVLVIGVLALSIVDSLLGA